MKNAFHAVSCKFCDFLVFEKTSPYLLEYLLGDISAEIISHQENKLGE